MARNSATSDKPQKKLTASTDNIVEKNPPKNKTTWAAGPTSAKLSADNTIVAFRTDESVNDMLRGIAADLRVDICVSGTVTDLVAVPAFMIIVNPQSLNDDDTKELFQLFSFLQETGDPRSFCILFTSAPPFKIPKTVRKFMISTPSTLDYEYLKLKILSKRSSSRRHEKQHRDYDRRVFRLLKMLNVLKSEGGLHVEDMCHEFGVSRKTVKRDIDLWNILGEAIEYDRNKKAYVLVCPEGLYGTLKGLKPPK